MTLTPAMLDAMVATGCTAEQIAAVVKASLADVDARVAQRRARDAERKRRHRMSRDVTRTDADASVTSPPPSSPPNDIYSNPPHHPPAPEAPDGASQDSAREQCEQVVAAFNTVAKPLGLTTCMKLTPKRLQACKARIRDHGLEAILTAIQRIPDSSFLSGRTDRWGGADIEFLLRPDSVTKILEGKYDDRTGNRTGQPADHRGDGLSRAVNRWANLGDAQDAARSADGRAVQPGQGHRQGALALPGPAD